MLSCVKSNNVFQQIDFAENGHIFKGDSQQQQVEVATRQATHTKLHLMGFKGRLRMPAGCSHDGFEVREAAGGGAIPCCGSPSASHRVRWWMEVMGPTLCPSPVM